MSGPSVSYGGRSKATTHLLVTSCSNGTRCSRPTKRCEGHLQTLLESDWLKVLSYEENDFEDERRNDELQVIRRTYIPDLVMELHTVLYETRDILSGNLEKSLQIANMVADESKKMYVEFVHAQKMPQLLSILRLSQVHALG